MNTNTDISLLNLDNAPQMPNSIPEMPEVYEQTDEEIGDVMSMLEPRKQRFCHLYLAGSYRLSDISMILKVTPATLRKWLKEGELADYIRDYQEQEDEIMQQSLKALRYTAVKTVNDLMLNADQDSVKLSAAKDVLDRTGHKPATTQNIHIDVKTFEEKLTDLMVATESEDGSYSVD